MLWSDKLFLGIGVKNHFRRIRWKVEHNKPQFDIYLLLLPLKYEEHLQLVPAAELLQDGWPKESVCVVGLALGRLEGLLLIEEITGKMVQELGAVDYYQYFDMERPQVHRGEA